MHFSPPQELFHHALMTTKAYWSSEEHLTMNTGDRSLARSYSQNNTQKQNIREVTAQHSLRAKRMCFMKRPHCALLVELSNSLKNCELFGATEEYLFVSIVSLNIL